MRNPFRYFNSSPEVIRLTVMMYIRSALDEEIQHLTLVVDRPPEPVFTAGIEITISSRCQ